MTTARFWRVSVAGNNGGTVVAFTEVAFLSAAGIDLSTGGVAIASSEYSATLVAANAFDKVLTSSSRWAQAANQWPAWIGYDHGVPVDVSLVRILCDTHPTTNDTQCPWGTGAVTIQCSADGAAWTSAGTTVWHGGTWTNSATVFLGFTNSVRAPAASRVAQAVTAGVPAFATRTSRAQRARDAEFGGTGRIWGTNEIEIAPGTTVPTGGRVVLLRQRDKLLARETWADPVTGAWAFEGLDTRQDFLALAEDLAGNYRPVAANRLTPEVP
jgi:hypothetical protein